MKKAIGLLEFKSIARGIKVTDEMLKSSAVEIVQSNSICPGKYISIVTGDVSAVNTAVSVGEELGGVYLIGSHVISNVHENVFPALLGVANVNNIKAIGVVETISALSSIIAADVAVKIADVEIVDLRIARGLGGKSFFIVSGEVSSVNQAVETSIERLKEYGDIVDTVVIPSPIKELLEYL